MTALFHHTPMIDDIDVVHILDGAQAVGNSDTGAALSGLVQGLLHNLEDDKEPHIVYCICVMCF